MTESETVVADAGVVEAVVPAVAPVVVQVVAITDADLANLKAKKQVGRTRYMIAWKTLDSLIARLEDAERRLVEE